MISNMLNVPKLKLVCFATIPLIRQVLISADRPSTPFDRTGSHFCRQANKLIGGNMIKI